MTAEFQVDRLRVQILDSAARLADRAATLVAKQIQQAVAAEGHARIIWATGNSQRHFLDRLTQREDVPWSRVTGFHLDEYLGLPDTHPASFRRYLLENLRDRVPLGAFFGIQGDCLEPLQECDRYRQLLQAAPLDLAILGVGDNGHLAFNEPSVANFDDPYAIKVVKLDAKNREQQHRQGHFPRLADVPDYAFTLTLSQLLACRALLCLVPGAHKAAIAQRLLTEPITPTCPATALRTHPDATLLLDEAAAALWQAT